MSSPQYKEILYTVIFRNNDATNRFKKWITTSKSIQAKIENNRLHIFDHNTLNLFVVSWQHGWEDVMIWDCWTKRHIYF
jgi:hypothetical protein